MMLLPFPVSHQGCGNLLTMIWHHISLVLSVLPLVLEVFILALAITHGSKQNSKVIQSSQHQASDS